MESDVVLQRTRVEKEEHTEKTEKSEKSERMSVREPSKETRHCQCHRKRTWMPSPDVLDSINALRGAPESKGEKYLKLPRRWKPDFLEDSQFDSGLVGGMTFFRVVRFTRGGRFFL